MGEHRLSAFYCIYSMFTTSTGDHWSPAFYISDNRKKPCLLPLEKVTANADGRGQNKKNKSKKPLYKSIINGLRLPHLTENFEEQSNSGEAGA